MKQDEDATGQALNSPTDRYRSWWKIIFIVLAAANILTIVLPLLFFQWLMWQAESGASGTEYIGFFFMPFVYAAAFVVSLLNVILILTYLFRHRPRWTAMVAGIVVVLLSVLASVPAGLVTAQIMSDLLRDPQYQSANPAIPPLQQQVQVQSSYEDIPKEQAINLIKTCSVKTVYYNYVAGTLDGYNGDSSPTGIVLTKQDGRPFRIAIADGLVAELAPLARTAHATCGSPEVWNNGVYEP